VARRLRTLAGIALLALPLAGCGRGKSALTPISLPIAAGQSASEPAVCIDPRDRSVAAIWLQDDGPYGRIWFARSRDRGATWSAPVAVTPPGEPLLERPEASPRLSCDAQGRVAVAWSTSVDAPGRASPASDVRFSRSVDGGVTWSAPVTLNDDHAAAPGMHSFHDMAATEDGRLAVAWLDSRPGGDGVVRDTSLGPGASIHYVLSSDFGGSWSGNSAQWSRACPECRVAVSMDFTGLVFVSYRRHLAGDVRDLVVSRPDGPPVLVHADGWASPECPRSGPALRVPRDQTLRMAWYTGAPGRSGVWFRHALPETYDSTVTPLPILTGEHLPVVHVSLGTCGPYGSVVACDADSSGGGRLSLVRVESSGRRVVERRTPSGTSGVERPQIASSNRDRNAYVVWTERDAGRSQVRMLRWELGR
jgi:hypothetical protein